MQFLFFVSSSLACHNGDDLSGDCPADPYLSLPGLLGFLGALHRTHRHCGVALAVAIQGSGSDLFDSAP